ncbi:hypothetical protein [Acinetobacter baumannii]|uniref:hypothetical protein n=1 Tax=Acinetobacter baumannii TaxID=470 RepID=UPI002E781CD8|nr:hypothetical protein [Acinetobacter baumannii]
MSNLFRYIALFFLFLQVGCSNGVYEQPADKYPFEVKMKALLGDNIEIIDSINKYEGKRTKLCSAFRKHNIVF